MIYSPPADVAARARATFWPEPNPMELLVLRADEIVSRTNPLPPALTEGPSVLLDMFEEKHCKTRHAGLPHNVLACVKAAYDERLVRDMARLAAMAASRGYGTPVSESTENSSQKWTASNFVGLGNSIPPTGVEAGAGVPELPPAAETATTEVNA